VPKRTKTSGVPVRPFLPIADLEREILRALSKDACVPSKRKKVIAELAGHAWKHPEDRVVYEAICRLGNRNTAALRAELPAEATRMGFPDIDWRTYFGPPQITARTIPHLLRQLKRTRMA